MKWRISWAVLALVFFISAWAQAAPASGRDCQLPGSEAGLHCHAIAVPLDRQHPTATRCSRT